MAAAAIFSSTADHSRSIQQDQQILYIVLQLAAVIKNILCSCLHGDNLKNSSTHVLHFARRLCGYTARLHHAQVYIPFLVRLIAQGFPCQQTRCLPCPQTNCPPPVEGHCSARQACTHHKKRVQAPVCYHWRHRRVNVLRAMPVSWHDSELKNAWRLVAAPSKLIQEHHQALLKSLNHQAFAAAPRTDAH